MWLLILSFCVCLTTITSLMFCLCWRKRTPKNDLLGLHGMVTQKNPDENVNHLPSVVAPCVVDGGNSTANTIELNDAKRTTTTTTTTALIATPATVIVATNAASASTAVAAPTTRRSLPDIPSEQIDSGVNWEPGDNSSEHYATVGQYQNGKHHHQTIPNGIETRPSISQHSSISQADDSFSPYEKVKYDKIKKQEHPYAQLQPTTSRQILEENSNVDERTNLLRGDGGNIEATAPSRSRRSSSHSGLGVDITAATAVAGGIAASPELPYMTPPVAQTNFSGDSQDSSKGYTSISVREPLANIIAQTKALNKKRELDPHYSTVSDDSDDVYTTIPDPNNQIYTSESETYARIPPLPITVEAEVNPTPSRCLNDENDINDEFYEPAPQQPPLPSVDSLKQVASSTHSRQASSSSSVANIGSPKPEKRQANSPLPPPPPPIPSSLTQQQTVTSRAGSSSSLSFDFHIEKIQNYRNIDDLYAKVYKNKRKEESDNENSPDKNRKSFDNFNRKSVSSSIGSNDNNNDNSRKCKEHNYETLRKNDKSSNINSNNNNNNDPGYEKIKNEEPGYASINGPDSITSSDPGYEVLKKRPSDIDPNYEELQHKITTIDGYSIINKKSKNNLQTTLNNFNYTQDIIIDEPNYESMPSELISEHNYAALKSNNSDTDPNYESVNSDRNNYEKIKRIGDVTTNDDNGDEADDDDDDDDEPPYERLNDDDSSRTNTDSISGYEKINNRYQSIDTSESSNGGGGAINSGDQRKSDPPYERLVNDNGDCDVPGYEKIKFSETRNNNNNNNEPNYATIKDDNHLLEENAIFQV